MSATININPLIDAIGGATATGATGLITAVVKAGGSTGGMPTPRVSGANVILPYPAELEFTDGVELEPLVLDVLPVGYFWALTIDIDGLTATYNFIIPADATYDFDELIFVEPSTMEEIPLYIVQVDYVQLNTSSGALPDTAGKMTWNAVDHTVDITTGEGGVVIQTGQETIQWCRNASGAAIAVGSVVSISGSVGQVLSIVKASNDSEITSSDAFGVVTHNGGIANNSNGFVTLAGKVRNLNTNAFNEGDELWLGTNGALTNVKPISPAHLVFVGWVVVKSGNGTIFVKVQNGYELDELHNVLITNPLEGQVLIYDATAELWKNGFVPN